MSGANPVVPNITFNEIPATPYYRPSNFVEVRANFGSLGILPIPARNLIIGQMISTGGGAGTATPGALQQNIIQPQQATALFGAGSMCEGAVIAYLAGPGSGIPLDVIGIADAGGATKAAQTITIAGTWTAAGTVAMNVCGVRFQQGVLTTDTPTTVAADFVALINADPQMPVTAANVAGVITTTAKNAGVEASAINTVVSPASGDVLPPGMTVTVGSVTVGTTNPNISAAISAITGIWYTAICAPYQDTTNLGVLTAELARRYTATVREDSRAYIGGSGSYAQNLTTAATANSQHVVLGSLPAAGSMPWQIAASTMSVAEASLIADPSLEVRDQVLPGIVGAPRASWLTDTQQELTLAGGGATYGNHADGTVTIQRLACTYNNNPQGVPDRTTWLVINEQAVASRIRYDWRNYLALLYPQNKLAPDGSLAAQYNSNVLTPSKAKGSWTVRMRAYAKNGWIVNETADATAAKFKIDLNDQNRLDYQVQYTRIGNLIVEAGVLEFVAQ